MGDIRRQARWVVGIIAVVLVGVIFLAVWLLTQRTDHILSKGLTVAAFVFVLGFVSLLLLRMVFFAFFFLIQQFRYRARLRRDLRNPAFAPGEEPMVSIIVPGYNEELVIEAALDSLRRIVYPNFEIVVVDDGSTDATSEKARDFARRHPEARIHVHTIPNGGKGNALNYGIRHSRGDFLLCVDADSGLNPEALAFCMRHFRDPRVGAVGGNVKVANQRVILTCLQAMEYVIGQNLLRRVQGLFGVVNIVPGPIGVFRRTALAEVGYYDDDTFAEDCDLTLKLLAKGWRVVDEINAIAWTEAPEKLKPFIRQRYRWTRGTLQSVFKHRGALTFRRGFRLGVIMWMMLFDGLIWPFANLLCHLCIFYLIFEVGLATFMIFWWVHFTLLDIGIALMCLASERDKAWLALLGFLYRFYFLTIMDTCKLLASLEEIFKLQMGWGKLERTGHGLTKPEGA